MQNFGKIKNAFNELVSEGITTNNVESSKLFKKYIKAIRENEMLKTQFLVVTNIETKVETDKDKATEYVKENINLFSSFDKKKLIEANNNLSEFIRLCEKGELLKEDFDYEHKALHENISTLIFTKKTPNTIDTIVEATNAIVNYILGNKKKELVEAIELPSSMLTTMMVDKYNDKYDSLDESDKRILKALIDSTPEEKSEVYTTTLRECIDLINEKLSGSDLDVKDKLLRVKDKLLNDKVDITEDFEKKISKLVELKTSLS
jgi:hypothetical protein